MSELVTEPNSLPSTPAFCTICTVRPSSSARRAAKSATLLFVARLALPCGIRKLRAKPFFTLTTSPNWPRLTTFSIRITCMIYSLVQIGVRQQSQEACTLHGNAQLTLEARLGTGNASRDQLAILGDHFLQDVQVLVIHFRDLLGGEAAELAALEQLTRRIALLVVFLLKYTSHVVLLSQCDVINVQHQLRDLQAALRKET